MTAHVVRRPNFLMIIIDQLWFGPAGVHLILADPWSKEWGQPSWVCSATVGRLPGVPP
jgi:hypothetical protein